MSGNTVTDVSAPVPPAVTPRSPVSRPAAPVEKAGAARTRLLLEGPIVSTLLRLSAPNVIVNVVLIAVTASVDAHFVGQLGPSALAGLSLVFPLLMLMQQMANSSTSSIHQRSGYVRAAPYADRPWLLSEVPLKD